MSDYSFMCAINVSNVISFREVISKCAWDTTKFVPPRRSNSNSSSSIMRILVGFDRDLRSKRWSVIMIGCVCFEVKASWTYLAVSCAYGWQQAVAAGKGARYTI